MKSVDVEGAKGNYRRARRIASVLKDRSERKLVWGERVVRDMQREG